jgi:hypothetical protein
MLHSVCWRPLVQATKVCLLTSTDAVEGSGKKITFDSQVFYGWKVHVLHFAINDTLKTILLMWCENTPSKAKI